MLRIILIRHGETEENVQGLMQGQSRGTLFQNGQEQASRLAERLATVPLDAIFSSDLDRAKITVQSIAKFHKCAVTYNTELRERSSGVFEGKSNREYLQAVQSANTPAESFRPPSGESVVDLNCRVCLFVDNILGSNCEEMTASNTVLISTHSGPLSGLVLRFLGRPLADFWNCNFANASVSEFLFRERNGVDSFYLNDIEHMTRSGQF